MKTRAVLQLGYSGAKTNAVAEANGVDLILYFLADSTRLNKFIARNNFAKPRITLPTSTMETPSRKPRIISVSNEMAAQMLQVSTLELSKLIGKDSTATMTSLLKNRRPFFMTIKCREGIEKVPVLTENVLGFIEGTDKKEEVIVISAHYDHLGIGKPVQGDSIYNGADDNGSGTVALMELSQAFVQAKQQGRGPRRSILFMATAGEEEGLLGSSYYVNHPVFPLLNTVTNINLDMVGRVDSLHRSNADYLYVVGADRLSNELHRVNEAVNARHLQLKFDYKYNAKDDPERAYERSDHYNFALKGIPVVSYSIGLHPDYHQQTDSADKIDFTALQRRCQAIFYTAWELANRENRVKLDAVAVEQRKP